MHNIKYLLRKKIDKMGLKKKFDKAAILKLADDFLCNQIKEISAKAEDYYNGNLILRAGSSVEANELYYFKEELKYFLQKNGYRIRKIRVVC